MRSIAPLSTFLASLLASASAFANGGDTCTSPPTVISSLPYNDTGDTTGMNNSVNALPLACNGLYTQVQGPDVIYQVTLFAGNSLTVTVTPTSNWDTSIFALSTCTDGNTCAAGHGADAFLSGEAESFTMNNVPPGTYFIYVDSFYADTSMLSAGPFTISVTGSVGTTPPQPPVASNGTLNTPEDTPGMATLVATDPNVGDVLTYQITAQPPAGEGMVTLMGNQATYTPPADFNGQTTFTFTATDQGNLVSNTATVTVNVSPVNDAPTAGGESATTQEDTPVDITLSASDVDVGDVLTFEIASQPPAAEGSVTVMGNQATFTPGPNFNGQTSFTFIARDSAMAPSSPATVTVDVTAVNDAPVAGDQGASTLEDTPLAITLMATDVDVGDTLTYEIATPPPMAEGTVMLAGDQAMFVPAPNFFGQTSFTFRALDSTLTASNVATVNIMVGALDDPPAFVPPTPTADISVVAGQTIAFTVAASDPDSIPTYDVMSKPAAATFDMMTGDFSWATTPADVGMHPVVLQAMDGMSTITRDITLEVTAVSGTGGAGGAGGGATGGAGGTGTGGTGTGGTGTGGTGTGGTGTGGTGTGGAGPATGTGGAGPGTGTGGGTSSGGSAPTEEGGCGCVTVGSAPATTPSAVLFGLLALLGLRRRRP